MEKGLLEKTGKSLDHWIKVVKSTKIEKHREIINFLKTTHGFTYGFANFVALKSKGRDAASIDDAVLVVQQYMGKQNLKPVYEKLVASIQGLGRDISIAPKKDSVSIIRKRQFALIKPATKTRIDLGLKLKDVPYTERLENSGPFGSMCTHRVRLTAVEEVDEQLMYWLDLAYQGAL